MTKINRRQFLVGSSALASSSLLLSSCNRAPEKSLNAQSNEFVSRVGHRFQLGGQQYRFTGANIWYAAYLGVDGPIGDRARLGRELDQMKSLGITNLRILASSEEGPLKAGIRPGFRKNAEWNEALFEGLDFCLAELAKRDMKAVLYLTNFWEWSGGMMTYLYYTDGQFIDMGDPAHPWPAFADYNSKFYRSEQAMNMYFDHVRKVVGRTNSVTGRSYAQDPTIMAWQLCNEPRPGGGEENISQSLRYYYSWIDQTAALIRSLDQNHLVSLGHEGTKGGGGRRDVVIRAHKHIDYVTAHIWPQNWGWVDGKNLAGTWEAGAKKIADYIESHVRLANYLDKPLVFEEFGFPRDGETYSRETTTSFRQQFYQYVYDAVEQSIATDGPVAGTNFWAWNGEARAQHEDYRFKQGDTQYMGDPPHEPQGWYGIFDTDQEMHALVSKHSRKVLM